MYVFYVSLHSSVTNLSKIFLNKHFVIQPHNILFFIYLSAIIGTSLKSLETPKQFLSRKWHKLNSNRYRTTEAQLPMEGVNAKKPYVLENLLIVPA